MVIKDVALVKCIKSMPFGVCVYVQHKIEDVDDDDYEGEGKS